MLFYLTFILLCGVVFNMAQTAYKVNNVKFVFFIAVAVLIPAVIGGYRDLTVGIDVLVYGESMFEYARSCNSINELIEYASTREYGYFILNYLCSRVSSDVHFFLFVSELIKYTLVAIVALHFREKMNPTVFMFTYIVMFYFSGLCLMRQTLAMCICFFAFIFLEKNKLVYLALITLAWTFHSSAFIMVMFLFVDILKNKSLSVYINIGIVAFLYVFSAALLVFLGGSGLVKENIADRYMDTGVATSKAELLIAFCILLYVFVKRKILCESSKYLLLTTTCYCLFFLYMANQFEVAARVAAYQMIALVLYVPMSFEELKVSDKKNYYLFWIILFLIHFYVSSQHGLSGTIPYSSHILGL